MKKILGIILGFSMLVPAFAYAATPSVTIESVKATIAALQAQIASLQRQLAELEAAAGTTFYVPWTQAKAQADTWRTVRPADAVTLDVIANTPQAGWFGNWNSNIYTDVQKFVNAAAGKNQTPILVFYNIPQRDCGSYSAGGAGSAPAYWAWVGAAAAAIGDRKAIVILEPDALANMTCLSTSDQANRLSILSGAVDALKTRANTKVYLDAGNARWISIDAMGARLMAAGVMKADGFSLNVSNYFTTDDNVAYGTELSKQVGDKHFVIDTSRNGRGPTADSQWCNAPGRAIGTRPTTATGNSLVDAFLWIKNPGESDGTCNGGPSAGTFWPEMALSLVHNR